MFVGIRQKQDIRMIVKVIFVMKKYEVHWKCNEINVAVPLFEVFRRKMYSPVHNFFIFPLFSSPQYGL